MEFLCHFEKCCWKFGGISCLISFLPLFDPDPDKKFGVWIRIHMDIFGILNPDPHENLCGSETLYLTPYLQVWIQIRIGITDPDPPSSWIQIQCGYIAKATPKPWFYTSIVGYLTFVSKEKKTDPDYADQTRSWLTTDTSRYYKEWAIKNTQTPS